MSDTKSTKSQPKGWYWVQDMNTAARPAYYDGIGYRNSPIDITPIAWHWPSFRTLARCHAPGEVEIKAYKIEGT